MNSKHNSLIVESVQIKSLRCFTHFSLNFESPCTFIHGHNGSGKTSILEALYYACYLRSFRAFNPRDLIKFDDDGFFVKMALSSSDTVQVGFSDKKRLVKINNSAISSYKELMDYYRVISITEDDLQLIAGGPQLRRSFIDQAIMLENPSFVEKVRLYRSILEQRNALLQGNKAKKEEYIVWTEQLLKTSQDIQCERNLLVQAFEKEVNQLLQEYCDESIRVSLAYTHKNRSAYEIKIESFLDSFYEKECRFRRSLFGAHLDDIAISFQGDASRFFASRGQQKLILFLIKLVQIRRLSDKRGKTLLLLDDFMTDFDEKRVVIIAKMLKKICNQLIVTAPIDTSVFAYLSDLLDIHSVNLSN